MQEIGGRGSADYMELASKLKLAVVLEAAFESGRKARCVVDGALTILAANKNAEREFAKGDCVAKREGRLWFVKAANRPYLESVSTRGWRLPTWFAAESVAGESALCFQTVRLTGSQPDTHLLKFWRTRRTSIARFAPLVELAKLTPAERRIVGLALVHDTTAKIAEAAGVRTGTVQSHLKRIYLKLNIHSRAELFQIVLGFLE